MSVNNIIESFSGHGVLDSQIEQLNHDAEEVQDRVYQLVGEVLVKIGENTQLLRFEQLELAKENIALKHQIAQLKMVHEVEHKAVIESARAHMSRICEKVKLVVQHFSEVDGRLNKLSAELERYSPEGETFHLKGGVLAFHATYKERLKSIFSEWLENLSEVQFKQIENYPDSKKKKTTQLAKEDDVVIPSSLEVVALAQSNEIVARFAKPQMARLKILETETVAMRALNTSLIEEKENIRKEHTSHINSLKGVIKIFQPDEILKGLHEFMKPFEDICKGKIPEKSVVFHELYEKKFTAWKDGQGKNFLMGYAIDASLFIQKVKPLIAVVEEFQADFDTSKTKEAK